MFHRGKRGQITVFVLLAIVILFAFMFLLFMKVFIEKSRYQVMATQQVQDYISQNSVSIYVTSCLDAVTKESIKKASLQGGVFNFTGMINGTDYVEYFVQEYNMTVKVPITIIPNNCSIVKTDAPDYPYPDLHLSELMNVWNTNSLSCKFDNLYQYSSEFFGYNRLLTLCNWNGANKVHATDTGIGEKTCEDGTYSDLNYNSIQEEIEKDIEKAIPNCVNFTEVLKRSPNNITQSGDPKVRVTFGKGGFKVDLQYPFILTIRGRQPIKTFYNFSIDTNIRFKELYDYSYFLSRTDVADADFNMIKEPMANEDLSRTYFNYDVKNIKSYDTNHTDIIQIVDNSTMIDGKPMIFQFAIKNRRPALDHIGYSAFRDIDIFAAENESITIVPAGYDPDDDDVEYNYYMWKEDYDEYFNDSNDNCTGRNGATLSFEYIKENCSIRIDSMPKNFTNSTMFKATLQNASYTPNISDMGYHQLKVLVREKDRQGLDDWQIVDIFVFDKPTANITATNRYGFPDNIASIEDPYILNGSNSVVGLSAVIPPYNNFSTFEWNDSKNEFNTEVEIISERKKSLYIPLDINGTYDIMNITMLAWSVLGQRNVTLKVNTVRGFFDMDEYAVDVKKCIPFRNDSNPSYPYNVPDSDPFFANHTCCSEGYDYTDGNVCFNNVGYGAYDAFDYQDYDYRNRNPLKPTFMDFEDKVQNNYNAKNDIIIRTFERKCSGDRGNICSGNATEVREVALACQDDNSISNSNAVNYQNERCEGPAFNNSNGKWVVSDSLASKCSYYNPGYTFESLANMNDKNGNSADGICTTSKQCASGPGNYGGFRDYGATGSAPYSCDGECSGDGRCNYPINCKCSNSCDADSLCNDLEYGSTKDVNTCSGSKTYIADVCVSCNRQDRNDGICTGASFDSSCTAPLACDGVPFNGPANDNNYQYCTDLCQQKDCYNNFAFNKDAGMCYDSCTSDSECRQDGSGIKCCTNELLHNPGCTGVGQNVGQEVGAGECFTPI
jgi:hypothetical protein